MQGVLHVCHRLLAVYTISKQVHIHLGMDAVELFPPAVPDLDRLLGPRLCGSLSKAPPHDPRYINHVVAISATSLCDHSSVS